jgi:uncharacterized protein
VQTPSVPELLAWRERYERSLKGPRGWWATTGIHWLDDGAHLVGSDPASAVLLARGTPRHVGTIERAGTEITFTPATSGALKLDGERVPDAVTFTATQGGHAFTLPPATFVVLRRQGRVAVRTYDATQPARRAEGGVAWFAHDPALVVEARFEPSAEPRTLPIVSVTGDVDEVEVSGHLTFTLHGRAQRITPFTKPDGFHLVFRDQTSGSTTYGAGRFLMTGPAVDGRVTLDFNRAYHPPCAHTPYATCPLPPLENALTVAIEAGERTPE